MPEVQTMTNTGKKSDISLSPSEQKVLEHRRRQIFSAKKMLDPLYHREHPGSRGQERDRKILISIHANRKSLSYNLSTKITKEAADELLLEKAVELACSGYGVHYHDFKLAVGLAREMYGAEKAAEVANTIIEKGLKTDADSVFTTLVEHARNSKDYSMFEKAEAVSKQLLKDFKKKFSNSSEEQENESLRERSMKYTLKIFDLLYSAAKVVNDRKAGKIMFEKGKLLQAEANKLKEKDSVYAQEKTYQLELAAAHAFSKSAHHFSLAGNEYGAEDAAKAGLASIDDALKLFKMSSANAFRKVVLLKQLVNAVFKLSGDSNSVVAHKHLRSAAQFCYDTGVRAVTYEAGINYEKMTKHNRYFLEQALLFAIAGGEKIIENKTREILASYSAYCELHGRVYKVPELALHQKPSMTAESRV